MRIGRDFLSAVPCGVVSRPVHDVSVRPSGGVVARGRRKGPVMGDGCVGYGWEKVVWRKKFKGVRYGERDRGWTTRIDTAPA